MWYSGVFGSAFCKKLQISYFCITGDILGNKKITLLAIIVWEVRVSASFFSIINYLNSQEKRQKKMGKEIMLYTITSKTPREFAIQLFISFL